MKIKTFAGKTVKEAIGRVKAEFGDAALILGTRKTGPGRHEVTAAVDYDLPEPKRAGGEAAKPYFRPSQQGATGASDEPVGELVAEVRELRELCWKLMQSRRTAVTDASARIEGDLLANGVDKALVRKIITGTLKAVDSGRASDGDYLRRFIKEKVSERIQVADPASDPGVVAFVGPAGVGKTTTIAKLAAIHALKKKRKLALVTSDTYRIAAAEQLKAYGRIIGVPVEVADSTNPIAACIDRHGDKDLVLVDTAGRGSGDHVHTETLESLGSIKDLRFNLVLSAQTRDDALYASLKGFSGTPIDSLTFTKLDMTSTRGSVLNTAVLAGRPVSYLASGQKVPEDIEVATKERILDFFMPN